MINIFEFVNKLLKSIFVIPNIEDVVVLVKVKIERRKEFSKLILSSMSIPDKINRLIKKEMNIRNDILIFSSVIFFSELNRFLFIMLLGLISLMISEDAVLRRMKNLVNLIPEEFEINDPPIEVINIKYKLKLLSAFINDKPELLKLLKTPMITFNILLL